VRARLIAVCAWVSASASWAASRCRSYLALVLVVNSPIWLFLIYSGSLSWPGE
jgi:hypothetical protein